MTASQPRYLDRAGAPVESVGAGLILVNPVTWVETPAGVSDFIMAFDVEGSREWPDLAEPDGDDS